MLRHNSHTVLARRKSTLSIQPKHQPIDPDVARQHAQAAAKHAYQRAQARNGVGDLAPRGSILKRNPSRQDGVYDSVQGSDAGLMERTVRHQHSVRFAGTTAALRDQSVDKCVYTSSASKGSSISVVSGALSSQSPHSPYGLLSQASSGGRESSREIAAEFAMAHTHDEYYTPEDDVASTPSSYQRLRKSKSLYIPPRTPKLRQAGIPEHSLRAPFSATRAAGADVHPLRAHKSLGLLRLGRRQSNSAASTATEEAVQLARDQYLQQANEGQHTELSSMFKRAPRQVKAFKKSVRSSSVEQDHSTIPVPASTDGGKVKTKARKVSATLKTTLRKFFGRSEKEPAVVPRQHVDASNMDMRAPVVHDRHSEFVDIPHPSESFEHDTISPLIQSAPHNIPSHIGSIKSNKSQKTVQTDEKSRVTSWNTSTAANTLTSRAGAHNEREHQRLSVINEHGTHIPSKSLNRSRLHSPIDQHLLHGRDYDNQPYLNYAPRIDGARVYSVLMKHVQEQSPAHGLEGSHKASMESIQYSPQVPPRSSSTRSARISNTPTTIRAVPSEERTFEQSRVKDVAPEDAQLSKKRQLSSHIYAARSDKMFTAHGGHIHDWLSTNASDEMQSPDHDDVFSPHVPRVTEQSDERIRPSTGTNSPIQREQHLMVDDMSSFGRDLVDAKSSVVPVVSGGLRESRSTFFGGVAFEGSKVTSPYRRAMAEQSASDGPAGKASRAKKATKESKALPQVSYTDSVYSRTTGGHTPVSQRDSTFQYPGNNSMEILALDGKANVPDGNISRPRYTNVQTRDGGSVGSVEWMRWMSTEVAKIDRDNHNRTTIRDLERSEPLSRTFQMLHVRERAQISTSADELVAHGVPSMDRESAPTDGQVVQFGQYETIAWRTPSLSRQTRPTDQRNDADYEMREPRMRQESVKLEQENHWVTSFGTVEKSGAGPAALVPSFMHQTEEGGLQSKQTGSGVLAYSTSIGDGTPGPVPQHAPPPPPLPSRPRQPLRAMRSQASFCSDGTMGKGERGFLSTTSKGQSVNERVRTSAQYALQNGTSLPKPLRSVKSFETPSKNSRRSNVTPSSASANKRSLRSKRAGFVSSENRRPVDDVYPGTGSRRMVEEFLKSRRMTDAHDDVLENSPGAFV